MSEANNILIGERIKKQRLLNGYSRERLAEMAGITPRFCYDLELGLKNMSTNTLLKLSEALNVSVDYLLFGAQTEKEEYTSIIGLVETCPISGLSHLEKIVSHYIQAINENTHTDEM